MRATLIVTESDWKLISETLFDDVTEHIAFGRAGVARSPGRVDFLLHSLHVPDASELDAQSPGGIQVSPTGVCRFLSWSREAPGIVDFHNHVTSKPQFSWTDDRGARVQWKVVQDFHPDALVLQLVFGPDGSFQARWADVKSFPRWRKLRHIQIVGPNGTRFVRPWDASVRPRSALSDWMARAHARTRLIMGDEPLASLNEIHVGVVGLGGNGSAVAALLPFYFDKITYVDPDTVEGSNLGRLFGAAPDDAATGATKVDVARRQTLRMRPAASVLAVRARFPSAAAIDALKDCHVIVACPDADVTRHELAEFAARQMKVLVELGTGVIMESGRVVSMGSQVRFQWPTGPCLACLNLTSSALEPQETTANKVRIGYVRGTTLTPAEVVTTNSVAASLAMRNLLAYLTGHLARPVPTYLLYDETRPSVIDLSSAYTRDPDCPLCGELESSVARWGDELPERLRMPVAPVVPEFEANHARD